ncbi:uncharacterized protein LOC144657857 [Oculina patagonica]
MSKQRRKKRKKLSSSSSLEGSSMNQDEVPGPQMESEDSIDEAPSLADVWKVLTEIKSNTEKLVNDVDSLKVNYKELQENLASTKAQVDILVKENKGLKSKVKSLEDDLSKSKEYSKEMELRLDDIEARHDDLEQYTRKFNLVIHGISEREDEDNVENVIELGKLLNVNLTRGDIDIVHRMNTKFKNKPRPIIVRFASYNAKNKLYKARLYLRNVTSQDLGPGKIYINENLTSWRADLFKEVRKVRKKYHNGKAWTIDGKIFFKAEFTSKAQRIDSYEDLKAL